MGEKDKHRETVVVLAAALVVAYYVREEKVFLILAGLMAATGLLAPPLSALIHRLWLGLAQVMGRVMSTVLLSVVFFLVFTPLALLRRLFSRRDVLRLKNPGSTVFVSRDHDYAAADLGPPW